MARPVVLAVALLLGACAAAPVPPAPSAPESGWTWEISYEDQGYGETVRGPRYGTAEEARRALSYELRGNTGRPLRARVIEADS